MLALLNPTILKYSALALGIVLVVGLGYKTAYNHGHLSGQNSCIAETEHLVKQIHNRISQVETSIDKLSDLAIDQQNKLVHDLDEILRRVKSKPVVVVKNGKCVPSSNFVEGINEAIRRANQK